MDPAPARHRPAHAAPVPGPRPWHGDGDRAAQTPPLAPQGGPGGGAGGQGEGAGGQQDGHPLL